MWFGLCMPCVTAFSPCLSFALVNENSVTANENIFLRVWGILVLSFNYFKRCDDLKRKYHTEKKTRSSGSDLRTHRAGIMYSVVHIHDSATRCFYPAKHQYLPGRHVIRQVNTSAFRQTTGSRYLHERKTALDVNHQNRKCQIWLAFPTVHF